MNTLRAGRKDVTLQPLDSPGLVELVAGWLAQKENHQWLDFGDGSGLTPAWLRILTQRKDTILRVYTGDDPTVPIGVVALDAIAWTFRTARMWAVAGDKSFSARGHAGFAVSKLLTLGFRELGLRAIHTWVVEGNPSVRALERLNFRYIGRQRQCHYIDGRSYDRLWFDLLASEHKDLD